MMVASDLINVFQFEHGVKGEITVRTERGWMYDRLPGPAMFALKGSPFRSFAGALRAIEAFHKENDFGNQPIQGTVKLLHGYGSEIAIEVKSPQQFLGRTRIVRYVHTIKLGWRFDPPNSNNGNSTFSKN